MKHSTKPRRRHSSSTQDKALERLAARGNKRQIERRAPGVFRRPGRDREAFDTSSTWLDSIRLAISEAQAALRDAR